MKLVCHRKVEYRTYVHDFDNGISYVQELANNTLKDDFFASSDDLFLDGSLKPNKTKYFYSPYSEEKAVKEVGNVRIEKFKWFDQLFYVDKDGKTRRFKSS